METQWAQAVDLRCCVVGYKKLPQRHKETDFHELKEIALFRHISLGERSLLLRPVPLLKPPRADSVVADAVKLLMASQQGTELKKRGPSPRDMCHNGVYFYQ